MRAVRSGEGERAFEEALRGRGEGALLVDVARRAASRGRIEEVRICLARLRERGEPGVDQLEAELESVVAAVRAHPAFGGRRAS